MRNETHLPSKRPGLDRSAFSPASDRKHSSARGFGFCLGKPELASSALVLRNSDLPNRRNASFGMPKAVAEKTAASTQENLHYKAGALHFGNRTGFFTDPIRFIRNFAPRKNRAARSAKGFALVSLMIFLPLALSLIFSSAILALLLVKKSESLQRCRVEVLQIQKDLGKSLHALLKLNPKALRLRAQKKRAFARLKKGLATSNAALIAAAKAEIAFLTAQQVKLGAEQSSILLQSESVFQKWKHAQRGLVKKEWPKALATVPDQPDIAPAYRPVANFTQMQTVQLNGHSEIPGNKVLPDNFQVSPVEWKCAASLRRKRNLKMEEQWQFGLVAAK